MRALLLILSLSLVLQVILGSPIDRQNDKNSLELIREFITKLGPLVKSVLQDMPKPATYVKYQQEWETFLKIYDTNNNAKLPCIDKTFNVLVEFFGLIHKYEEDNTNPEIKEVKKIFNKHGLEDLRKTYEPAVENAKDPPIAELFKDC